VSGHQGAPALPPPPPATFPAGAPGSDVSGQVADLFRPASDNGAGYAGPGNEPPGSDAPFGVVGTVGRSGPWTGFGRPDDGEEYLGPFLPPAPLTRPTRDQSRLVLLVVAGVVVAVLGVALWSLRDFGASNGDVVLPAPSASTAPPSPTATASGSPSASTSASPTTPAVKPVVVGLRALDPLGDDEENDALVSRAFDGDPGTAWRSSRYKTQLFGGLKDGLGIAVRLEERAPVAEVTIDSRGSDGIVELRVSGEPTFEGSSVVATGNVENGKVVLRPTRPISTEFLVLWITRLPQVDGQGQMFVSEIAVK
jgi:putative peptidoglycan lipid II flippase